MKIKIIEICLSSTKEEEEEKPSIRIMTYSLKEVMNRLSSVNNTKPVTIFDLKGKINTFKSERRILKSFQSKTTQDLATIFHTLDILDNGKSITKPGEDFNYLNLNTINNIVHHKWHIRITLVIQQEYTIKNIAALVDSGADINCIQEGIVPTQYFEKTTQGLTNASGSKMVIKYKLNGVYICNQGIYLETSFLCIRNLQQQVILGTPFLAMLMPMQTSSQGIAAKIDAHNIFFEFISQPIYREINDNQIISFKEKSEF